MKSLKWYAQNALRSGLTIISPRLNTEFTYFIKFKKKLDLNNPITLNEKVLWLKFNTYYNNQTIKQCADKYRVREYLTELGYRDILCELIGVYDDIEKINWESLPQKFALKLNVGCGHNIIVTDKSTLNIKETKKILNKWMKSKDWIRYSEMQYKDVKPYILIEEYLGDENGDPPVDYKFYCMNGQAKYVMACFGREKGKKPKFFYFDKNWKMMPFTNDSLKYPDFCCPKPESIDKAFEIAENISEEFPFVRTDLYIVNNKIYFGELTFTPSAGLDNSRLYETDVILGKQLSLPRDN